MYSVVAACFIVHISDRQTVHEEPVGTLDGTVHASTVGAYNPVLRSLDTGSL